MLEVLLLPDTFPQYRLLHLIQFAKYVEAHSFWGLCSSWGVGKWTQRSKGVKASGTKCSWAYGMTPWTQQSWAKTLLWPAWLSSKCRPLLAGVTLYSKARRNWRSAVQFWHESALTLTRGSLGLCSLAVMGQPPRIREVSLKVLRLSAPCGSCWSWFAPFVITLRILPLTALWRCEDNSHGPGSLGLKIPYSGQLFSAVRAWGRAHAFTLVNLPFGKPVRRDLISPVFCSSLEFCGSKNIIFWIAHWERVCSSSGWMWGMRKGILVSGKGGCVRGWWRSTYLVP